MGIDDGSSTAEAGDSPGLTWLAHGILTNVHPPAACADRHCWIHNPSAHHMTTWPVRWRGDRGTAERVCSHAIGHPDPDDVEYNRLSGRDVSVHGCDGCCLDGK